MSTIIGASLATPVEETASGTEQVEQVQADEKAAAKKAAEEAKKAESKFAGYTLIKVYGGNTSGHRQAKVVVDIGYGNRE